MAAPTRPGGSLPGPCYLVEIIGARNVPKLDLTSESDPFVKFWIEDGSTKKQKGVKCKSLTKDDNANPRWNCIRNLAASPNKEDMLVVSLYDEDASTNEHIGKIAFPIFELTTNSRVFKIPTQKWELDVRILPAPKKFKVISC